MLIWSTEGTARTGVAAIGSTGLGSVGRGFVLTPFSVARRRTPGGMSDAVDTGCGSSGFLKTVCSGGVRVWPLGGGVNVSPGGRSCRAAVGDAPMGVDDDAKTDSFSTLPE